MAAFIKIPFFTYIIIIWRSSLVWRFNDGFHSTNTDLTDQWITKMSSEFVPNIYFFVLHNVDNKALYYWLLTLDSVKPQNISNVPSHQNVFFMSMFNVISTFFFKWSSYIIYLNLNKYVKPQQWPLCIKPQRWPLLY